MPSVQQASAASLLRPLNFTILIYCFALPHSEAYFVQPHLVCGCRTVHIHLESDVELIAAARAWRIRPIDIVRLSIVGERYEPDLVIRSLKLPSQMVPDVWLRCNACDSRLLPPH